MKGVAGLMLMMAAIVLSVTVAGFSTPISQSLAVEATEAITDVSAISRTNAYSSNYLNDHLRQAARYSLHNRSYELGANGGGVDWDSEKVSEPLEKTFECGDNELEQLNCRLEEQVAERTSDYELDAANRCTPKINSPSFAYRNGSETFSAKKLKLDCELNNRTVSRTIEEPELGFNGSEVRYSLIAHTAYSYMHELQESWNAGKYSGEAYSCGSPEDEDYEEAEEEAADSADNEVENNFDSVSISLPVGVELESSIVDTPDELAYGTNPDAFSEADQEVEVEEGDCCSRDDDGSCSAYDHDIYMNVTPEQSEVELSAEDTDNEVVVNDGWRNLAFAVDNYVHSFD